MPSRHSEAGQLRQLVWLDQPKPRDPAKGTMLLTAPWSWWHGSCCLSLHHNQDKCSWNQAHLPRWSFLAPQLLWQEATHWLPLSIIPTLFVGGSLLSFAFVYACMRTYTHTSLFAYVPHVSLIVFVELICYYICMYVCMYACICMRVWECVCLRTLSVSISFQWEGFTKVYFKFPFWVNI